MVKKIDQKQQGQESEKLKIPVEKELEMLGVVMKLHGTNQIKVLCKDGVERGCRIPGKLKKRVWIRENDLVIVKLWDFQPIKADVIWRFKTDYAKSFFRRKGMLGELEKYI